MLPDKQVELSGTSPKAPEEQTAASPPSPPDLPRRLRHCWAALLGGARFCYLQCSHEHASAGVIDTRQGSLRGAVCERFCSLQWPARTEETRFVEHLLEMLGMSVRWEQPGTANQINWDCQFRSTFKQLEFQLGQSGEPAHRTPTRRQSISATPACPHIAHDNKHPLDAQVLKSRS